MEILTSGSFINLENKEKIEQLKFTAEELAQTAIETDGFVNVEESNRALALEFWQGLEYMCRAHEEATIKNIFIGNFLDFLRERRAESSGDGPAVNQAAVNEIKQITVNEPAYKTIEDEFLGLILNNKSNPVAKNEALNEELQVAEELNGKQEQSSNSREPKMIVSDEIDIEPNESPEILNEPSDDVDGQIGDAELGEVSVDPANESADQTSEPESTPAADEKLQIPQKEPYQFNKCTVTAVLQLLPVTDGDTKRRVVISIRTHDFAPQITLAHLDFEQLSAEFPGELETALAKYQEDLPLKVMDKLKKEKKPAKKSPSKPVTEAKTTVAPTPTTSTSDEKNVRQVQAPQANADLSRRETDIAQQGSLF